MESVRDIWSEAQAGAVTLERRAVLRLGGVAVCGRSRSRVQRRIAARSVRLRADTARIPSDLIGQIFSQLRTYLSQLDSDLRVSARPHSLELMALSLLVPVRAPDP
jgi:hypothetical protein